MILAQHLAEQRDRAAALPGLHIFPGAIGEVSHALGMRPGAVCLALDKRCSLTCPRTRHRPSGGGMHRQEVVAIHLFAGKPVIGSAPADIRYAAGVGEGHLRGELVVLADKQHRQLPDGRHVQALMEGPVVDGAIAEERHRHLPVPGKLERVSAAGSLQDAWPHDAAGAHHADLGGEQVHAPPPATRATRGLAEQFSHQIARRHPLGQRVPMAPMGAEHHIPGIQVGTNSRGNRLLPHIGVAGAMNEALLMAAGQFLLRVPYHQHGAVHGEQPVPLNVVGCHKQTPKLNHQPMLPPAFIARFPPSIGIRAPVIQELASEANKTISPWMSVGRPNRPAGIPESQTFSIPG